MPSNPAKRDGRSDDASAGYGDKDDVETIADLTSWRWTKQSLSRCSGDYRKYANQHMGHQQARRGDFTGIYRLFSNFFQN
jgi:hypothetical protein